MSNRPPSCEIAAYARENITCRNCAARPGSGCVEQAERWRTVCTQRFADAAAEYVPRWKDQAGRRPEPPGRRDCPNRVCLCVASLDPRVRLGMA